MRGMTSMVDPRTDTTRTPRVQCLDSQMVHGCNQVTRPADRSIIMHTPAPTSGSVSAPVLDEAATQTSTVATTVATKPTWMDWFCETDDIYWGGDDPDCWFCGSTGRVASRPRMTSQHGFGPELVA